MPLDREEMIMLGRGSPRRPRGKGIGSFIIFCIVLVILGAGGYLLYSYFAEDIHNWFSDTFTQQDESQDVTPATSSRPTEEQPVEDSALAEEATEATAEEIFPTETKSEATERVITPENEEIFEKWKKVEEIEKAGNNEALEEILKEIIQEQPGSEHEGNAIYRLACLYRKLGQEAEARELWRHAYEKLGSTWGGRLSALVLADIWYNRYCNESNPVYENWEVVRNAYSAAIGMDKAKFISPADKSRIISRLNKLNARLVFSSAPCKGAEYYTVGKNDTLGTIAKRYEVHYDSIITINGLRGDYIRPGQRLKIIRFSSVLTKAVVDKTAMTLTLYHDGKWIKQYPICHGGDKTHTGTYTILVKAPNPQWTDPATNKVYDSNHPNNILGTHWIGFNGTGPSSGIGIHGTTLPSSIPGDSSNGCVRMYNKDVKEVYGILILGSEVRILP